MLENQMINLKDEALKRDMLANELDFKCQNLEQGKPEEALQWFGRALELDPEHADAWCGRGKAHFDLGRLERADRRVARILARRRLVARRRRSRRGRGRGGRRRRGARAHQRRERARAPPAAAAARRGVVVRAARRTRHREGRRRAHEDGAPIARGDE